MDEKTFKSNFISTFIACWCANNWDGVCDSDNEEDYNKLRKPPMEDAIDLAQDAWQAWLDTNTSIFGRR